VHYKTFAFTTQLYENSMKRCFQQIFYFLCFATFMFQNLPARGRKTEKNKGIAFRMKRLKKKTRPYVTAGVAR
jgi:hypothetical protein